MIQIGLDCVTQDLCDRSWHLSQPFTCYWHKCRMAHTMPYPSSIVHGLSTCWFCTYTPSRAEEAVVTELTGLEKTEDWHWKKKKLNTQGGWTLQESRVDFASLCTVVPWDLHSQDKNSKAKLLWSSRIVPWRIYWFLVLRYSRGGTSGGLFWLAAWGCPLAAMSA